MDQLVQNVRAKEWAEMIRQQKASNLTVVDWCKANNLGTNTYYYRQRKLRRMAVESSPKFVEIKASDVSSKEVNPVPKHSVHSLRRCFDPINECCFSRTCDCHSEGSSC